MPTDDERCKAAIELETVLDSWDLHDLGGVVERLAGLIKPEPVCVANITFTKEQQEELFQRVMLGFV